MSNLPDVSAVKANKASSGFLDVGRSLCLVRDEQATLGMVNGLFLEQVRLWAEADEDSTW